MPDPAPNPELLRSLGKLARGLSALFWGLPASLIICVQTLRPESRSFGMAPPLASLALLGLLLYGLWQMGDFQKQERPWRFALDRARLIGLVNLGLAPFLFWSNRLPGNAYFQLAVLLLAFSGLLFLFNLNVVLERLGAMLPDETLRHETRQFTRFNRVLLVVLLLLAVAYLVILHLRDLPLQVAYVLALIERLNPWSVLLVALLPLAMTMALIWKTKEVILDSVFRPDP